MVDYTTDALLLKIENDILDDITTTSVPFNTSQVLALASDILREECAPFLIGLYEEYYVTYEDTALVVDQAGYDIPANAAGAKLRDVTLIDPNDPSYEKSLAEVPYSDVRGSRTNDGTETPLGYYIKANKVMLFPTPNSTRYSLRMSYYKRPALLVQTSDAVTIASGSGTSYVMSGAPSWGGTDITVNIQKANPHFDLVVCEGTGDSSGTSLTLDADPDPDPSAGDYVTESGYVAIPELPVEAHPWLAQLTAAEILEARGDFEGASRLLERAEMRRERLRRLFTPRNDGEPKKVTNRYGLLKKASRGWLGRGW